MKGRYLQEIPQLHKTMPFKSKAQVGYMFVHHPQLAKEFAEKTLNIKKLPRKIKPKVKK